MILRLIFLIAVMMVCGSSGSSNMQMLEYFADHGNCEYYRKFDNMKNCGPNGYPLRYGYKYCTKFTDYYSYFDEKAIEFIESARKCLMKKLMPLANSSLTCAEIEDAAFESHPDCYIQPEANVDGFCCVVARNNNIFGFMKVFDVSDLLGFKSIKQITKVLYGCIRSTTHSCMKNEIPDIENKLKEAYTMFWIKSTRLELFKKRTFK